MSSEPEKLPIERLVPYIRLFVRSTPSKFEEYINNLSNKNIKILANTALNILKGSVPLQTKELELARRDRSFYKKMSSQRISIKKKHELLKENQRFARTFFKLITDIFHD